MFVRIKKAREEEENLTNYFGKSKCIIGTRKQKLNISFALCCLTYTYYKRAVSAHQKKRFLTEKKEQTSYLSNSTFSCSLLYFSWL
jgi:hypothetical protein